MTTYGLVSTSIRGRMNLQLTVEERHKMKYPNMSWGTMEAVVNKHGGEEGIARFLRGETCVTENVKKWREQDGVIYFSVTSDGTTGEEWIARLDSKKYEIETCGKSFLRSPDFKPTKGVTTEVAVLKGMLFDHNDRITCKIRAKAETRKFENLNDETACLIREKFTDKELEEMGLWMIVVMNDTASDITNDSSRTPRLLGASRSAGGRLLDVCFGGANRGWGRDDGFAFAVYQFSA